MSIRRLAWRGIRHYWRIYLCMGLGIALTASLISGSLILGTSVRSGLRQQALEQLGPIQWSLSKESGFFRAELASKIAKEVEVDAHALLFLGAVAQHPEEAFPPEEVRLIGAPEGFPALTRDLGPGRAVLNRRAQSLLGLHEGDTLIVRVAENPGSTGERPMAQPGDEPRALRLQIMSLDASAPSLDFSINRSVPEAANVWVDRSWLAQQLGHEGRANIILVTGDSSGPALTTALRKSWRLEDLGLGLSEQGERVQLNSEQVVISRHVVETLRGLELQQREFLAWFAFEFGSGEKKSPYGFLAAQTGPDTTPLKDDEVVVNQWLADDLGIEVGATLVLSYPDFSRGSPYVVEKKSFKLVQVLPMEGAGGDALLMPDFPGFAGVKSCRDWKPGVDFDPSRIRPSDELYWKQHRGAPKAFVSMKAAESIARNPYGIRTAIRFSKTDREEVEQGLLRNLELQHSGYSIQNLREHHLAASVPANDLGQLFLGFGFLLMASALLLTAMLFAFSVLRRKEELYTLSAMGWSPKETRSLLTRESMTVAAVFAGLGAVAGLWVARALLEGLDSFWRGAIGATPLGYEARSSHVLVALAASLILARLVLWLAARKMKPRSSTLPKKGSTRRGLTLALASGLGCIVAWFSLGGVDDPIGAFVVGLLVLVTTLCLTHAWLADSGTVSRERSFSFGGLALRYVRRRPGRSLSLVVLTALGCFLVLAVGANQKDPLAKATERTSGTGGFEFYGESTLPIVDREALGNEVVPFRKRAGDDASCLNLGNAQNPTVLGVHPPDLSRRGAFGVKGSIHADEASVWGLLEGPAGAPVPVIGDEATLRWGLKLGPGEELEILGEGGTKHRLKVVAMLSTNVLQGSLIMSESNFKRLFPEQRGYQVFLVDAPGRAGASIQEAMATRYGDLGLRLKPTTERLAQFHAVENTYLDIFQALGTLGMMLGILGLAIMLLFNVIDRRSDLRILWAMGFRRRRIALLLALEHLSLMMWGLLLGTGAALVTMWPSLASPGDPVSMGAIAYALMLIVTVGVLSTVGALSWALHSKEFSSSTAL